MSSKFLNLSTDNTLGGVSPSDTKAVSEKAIKGYVDTSCLQNKGSITNATVLTTLTEGIYTVNGVTHTGFPNSTQTYYGVLIQYGGDYKPQLLIAGVPSSNGFYYRRYLTGSSTYTAWGTIPTNTNELTNGAGFITGITSSDVTTALGYTPANVFIATYGTTTYADISAAITAGEIIIVKNGDSYGFLNSISTGVYNFSDTVPLNGQFKRYRCFDDNTWGTDTYSSLDTNLSNLTATGKRTATEYPFPSTTSTDVTIPANEGSFIATETGWVQFVHRISTAGHFAGLATDRGLQSFQTSHTANQLLRVYVPVVKGDTVTVYYQSTGTPTTLNSLKLIKSIGVV